jgi:tol-pal system protein YbgF
MIKSHQLLLGLCIICFLPLQLFAEAPVVDDSDNFAILDEQQAVFERPVAKAQLENSETDDEIALARDNYQSSGNDNNDLLNKIQGMQQDIQELRGQLEVQAHALKLLQQQQLAFYKDLDTRLPNDPTKTKLTKLAKEEPMQELSLAGPKRTTISPKTSSPEKSIVQEEKPVIKVIPTSTSRTNPADEQISYLAAYDLVKNKHFEEALLAMRSFVTRYPQGGYTANAQYWLGELYMVKDDYPEAIKHFEIVLKQFPSSSKAAASTLKIGYALAASGKENEARQRLQQVLKNYPDTPTAQLAAIKLKSLGVS